ncbi:MAG TPA: carbonic anhydrase [Polyangia bacterium]
MSNTEDAPSLSPRAALQRLVEGNRRFLANRSSNANRAFRAELADQAQRPFAIVLGCSDSRTPVEILFDEGFGDLFVVRIAGQIVAPSVVGSIEFAAAQFGTRLVVVLGHTRCGAVGATVKALQSGDGPESKNIRAITDRISPHIQGFVQGFPRAPEASLDPGLLRESMRINVRASAEHLRHGSQLLEELVLSGQVAIVGAEYELETGQVHFFDGLPLR